MASTRKSRMVNKRFSRVNEESPEKDGSNLNKSRPRKRKLSVMLGSQWSKEELERFYDAYRKYGKDWKKVAGVISNRSVDMVEALYNMNRAYLSLPEGTASVAGLIAMMTDHYNLLEGSDSEKESNDGLGTSRKAQKHGQGKFKINSSKRLDGSFPDLLQHQSVSSSYGCLSLLKKKRSGGSRPRVVGKRTPRFPVSYLHDRDDGGKFVSPNKQGLKSAADTADDEVAHVAALALAEAAQRGGSPQVSCTPSRKTDNMRDSPIQNGERKQADSEMASTKAPDEEWPEGSLGSREAENGDYYRETESASAIEKRRKAKKFQGKKSKVQGTENNHFDDVREACSGTEEGLTLKAVKDEFDIEVTDGKAEGSRKRSRQLDFEDESLAVDALQTLADLSFNILAPASAVDSESSVRVKEEKRNADIVEKPNAPEATSATAQKERCKVTGTKVKRQPLVVGADINSSKNSKLTKDPSVSFDATKEGGIRKRKRKSFVANISKAEVHSDSLPTESNKTEASPEEGKKSANKSKRVSQIVPSPKQGKLAKSLEHSSSSTDLGRTVKDQAESNVQVISRHQVNLPTRLRSRRKKDLKNVSKETMPVESVGNDKQDKFLHLMLDRAVPLKKKLSHCLSSQMLRKWCTYEWFYSAIDYPWFARSEFVEYLNHVGLGHVPRLTRVEWGVIRSSLGKPRRLSKQFLCEEREKLEEYREKVRTHYTELRDGIREGLPTDLARPLSVGQRVIACHPKTREIHDGRVLTVERNRCRVQFDRPELGVEFVMDVDCMPLNPLENLSEALRRQSAAIDKFRENFNDLKLDSPTKESKLGGSIKFSSSDNMENANGLSHVASSNYPMNTLMKQAKGDTLDDIVQAKAAANEVVAAQATYGQPCTLAQIQAREADIRALSELTRALDKKEALLLELKHMNEEFAGNQKEGDAVKDENFRKQYATVLVQLDDASIQVANALGCLRQRNTYNGNTTLSMLSRPVSKSVGPAGPPSSYDHSINHTQESGSEVVQIVESSRRKARTMVDAAMEAMSTVKEGEDALARIGEAIDSASNQHLAADLVSVGRSSTSSDQGHGSSAFYEHAASNTLEPTKVHSSGAKQNTSDGSEAQLPSELISSCVATLLMIQTCTERHFPPADVAQIIDSAETSLQPCCSQNLPIYRDIQQCIRIIKNQVLALIPTTVFLQSFPPCKKG